MQVKVSKSMPRLDGGAAIKQGTEKWKSQEPQYGHAGQLSDIWLGTLETSDGLIRDENCAEPRQQLDCPSG